MTTMNKLIAWNFHAAVLIALAGGVAVLIHPQLLFPEITQRHDPLARNLLLIVFYLVAIQAMALAFRHRHHGHVDALFMGGLLLIAALGVPLYSYRNEIPLRPPLVVGLAYCGISQLLYFFHVHAWNRH